MRPYVFTFILYNFKNGNLFSPNIIKVMRSRKMKWEVVLHTWMRNAFQILAGEPEGNITLQVDWRRRRNLEK
jgi:hypothetical protein